MSVIDSTCEVRLDHRLANTPSDVEAVIAELRGFGGEITIGLDVWSAGSPACGRHARRRRFRLVQVPGLAVARTRQGTAGGESKSDPRDARVIADQVPTRRDLLPVDPTTELHLEIRLLVSWRRDLVDDHTRRFGRPHDLLVSIFPGF